MAEVDVKALLNERKEMIQDIIRQRKKPKRVPIMSQVRSWPIYDAGSKMNDAYGNFDVMFDIMDKFQARYNFDWHFMPGTRFPVKLYQALGAAPYVFDNENDNIQREDKAEMDEDEYPVLIEKGLLKFIFENYFTRRYQMSGTDKTIRAIANAQLAYKESSDFQLKLANHQAEKYGVPRTTTGLSISIGMESLQNNYRGFKALSRDMRRSTTVKYIEKALEVLDNGSCEQVCQSILTRQENELDLFAYSQVMLVHNILSHEQFGKYYWPWLKKGIDATVKADKIGYLFTQGTIMHLLDYFEQIPKGHFIVVCELDDISKLLKLLPNLSFCGGINSQLLAHGTKQECIDQAKKLIDEAGYDGRLVAAADKMLAHRGDCKGENLEAVNQFILEYGVYK